MKALASLILAMTIPVVPNALGDPEPEESPQAVFVSPATMNRIFKEAEAAFSNKEYDTAVAKCEELLEMLGSRTDGPAERLYFQIGLGRLLGGKYPEAMKAFKNCIARFPKGEYTSRAYLGLGRACMKQKQPEKKEEAIAALKMAAANPKFKAEAERLIIEISQSPAAPNKIEQAAPSNGDKPPN